MGYYVSHMIGIRTGGVFSDGIDMSDLKQRLKKISKELQEQFSEEADPVPGFFTAEIEGQDNFGNCLSVELSATKGSYVVLAGVFNYWMPDKGARFAQALSKEFGAEVMHMGWDEQKDTVQCNIYLDGRPMFEVNENPIGQILRRIG